MACLICLNSCKDKTKTEETGVLITDSNSSNTNAVLGAANDSACAINPLVGYWLSANYQKNILANLSPYKCSKTIYDVSEIAVDKDAAKVVYGNAEAEELSYKIEQGEKFEMTLKNQMKFRYKGNNKAQLTAKKIDEEFVKVEEPLSGRSILEQFVVSRLIVGEYESKFGNVVFKEDGRIQGLEKYASYKVFTTFEELSDFDLIEFRDLNEKADYKAWAIDGDVLILYEIVPGSAYLFEKGDEWLRLKLKTAVG